MRYTVNYTVYQHGDEVYTGEIELYLESPHDALDILNEQPIEELTDNQLDIFSQNVTIEVNHVEG